MGEVTDPRVERILADLEADTERAMRRAVSRLTRLPVHVRAALDPYGLLLRPDPRASGERG
jgi:hypothetical protein